MKKNKLYKEVTRVNVAKRII